MAKCSNPSCSKETYGHRSGLCFDCRKKRTPAKPPRPLSRPPPRAKTRSTKTEQPRTKEPTPTQTKPSRLRKKPIKSPSLGKSAGLRVKSLKEAAVSMKSHPPEVKKCTQPKAKKTDKTDKGHVFFREDDRDLHKPCGKIPRIPDEGFEAWVQLSLEDAKKVATRFNGKSTGPLVLAEKRAEWLGQWIKKMMGADEGKVLSLSDMGNCIKFKVDQSSVQISTGITKEGGGRGKMHLHKITVPEPLYLVDPRKDASSAVLLKPYPEKFPKLFFSRLVMDAKEIKNATLIAIAIVGGEVAFLTRIPRDWIEQVR